MRLFNKCKDAAAYQLRRTLGLPAKDVREEWRRLNWLVHSPRAVPGEVNWQGISLRYSDGFALYSQLYEAFVQKQYDFYPGKRDPVLFDVGAHVGIVSLRWSQLFPGASITSIEADAKIASMLEHNLSVAGVNNIKVRAQAAWTHNRGVCFRSSGIDDGHVAADEDKAGKAPSVDLAELLPDEVDFLKMDVEGAEFELLPHLSASGKLKGVRRIFLELHQWDEGISRIPEVMYLLQKNGFDCRVVASMLFKPANVGVFSDTGWGKSHVLLAAQQKT
jgi:FkbM family methyltransferase